ncbi:hypothetical protein [Kitasatospora sp. NPDC004289]
MRTRTVLGALALAATLPLFLSAPVQAAQRSGQDHRAARSFADIMDLDAGAIAFADGVLGASGAEGAMAVPGNVLGNLPPVLPH